MPPPDTQSSALVTQHLGLEMLTCGCGRWMHTEGIEECSYDGGAGKWFVRSECRGCGLKVGIEVPAGPADGLVDRLMWTDDALHRLDRCPPYVAPLIRQDVESFARQRTVTVVTYDLLEQAKLGGVVAWELEAERRLDRVPAAIRAMARVELERTALDRGQSKVTVALMEEVKVRYFGMGAKK